MEGKKRKIRLEKKKLKEDTYTIFLNFSRFKFSNQK